MGTGTKPGQGDIPIKLTTVYYTISNFLQLEVQVLNYFD